MGCTRHASTPLDEAIYQGIEVLLGEVAGIFPDKYVHVGGDEVNPTWWQSDPAIASYLEQEQLSIHDLQNQFLIRVCSMVTKLGRKAIGWDEVLHPQMPDCVVQNWRGATSRDRALALPRPVLVSGPYYLDLHYPADVHYGFDPEAEQSQWLAQEDALQQDPRLSHVADGMEWTKHWRKDRVDYQGEVKVLGGEACLWAELVNPEVLSTRLYSRLPAVAERLWSPVSCMDPASMYERLQALLALASRRSRSGCPQEVTGHGFTEAQLGALCLLEPVKWYGRLLGEEALQARLAGTEMPKARPYHADTPLNRVVDFLPPESMPARQLAELSLLEAATQVKGHLVPWGEDLFNAGDELRPVLLCLSKGADLLFAFSAGELSAEQALRQMQALAKPQGRVRGCALNQLVCGPYGTNHCSLMELASEDKAHAQRAALAWFEEVALEPLGNGHIHQTYLLQSDSNPQERFVLQKINGQVYGDIPALMSQTLGVLKALSANTHYCANYRVPELVSTREGDSFCIIADRGENHAWRLWRFVENSMTCDPPTNRQQIRAAARAFGGYQSAIAALNPTDLIETIPGFLNMTNYLRALTWPSRKVRHLKLRSRVLGLTWYKEIVSGLRGCWSRTR